MVHTGEEEFTAEIAEDAEKTSLYFFHRHEAQRIPLGHIANLHAWAQSPSPTYLSMFIAVAKSNVRFGWPAV
jgi:hypothetical protein